MVKEPTSCPCKFLSTSLSSFTAAEYGDIHSLSKIKDVATRKDDAGYNPLHFTAQFNHVAATALLLQLGCPVDGGGFCGATPLHRAAFSGATAAMRVLLEWKAPNNNCSQTSRIDLERAYTDGMAVTTSSTSSTITSAVSPKEEYCDLFARDTSFGDESTPLHKAATGGRYLAVHMILEALKDRDSILGNVPKSISDSSSSMRQSTSWLQHGLSARDKYGRTPLEVAEHFFRIQDTERDSVARWDEVAGGVADWGKCAKLLERAAMMDGNKTMGTQLGDESSSSSRAIPRLPLHLRKGVMSCLDCGSVSGNSGTVCMTANWQASFQEALGNSAMRCIVACTPTSVESRALSSPATCSSRASSAVVQNENNEAVTKREIPKTKSTTVKSICKRCKKPTIAFYQLPGVGTLVCKSCKRLA